MQARRLGDAEVVSKPVSLDRLTTMLDETALVEQAPA
jgi:hypothetical protein